MNIKRTIPMIGVLAMLLIAIGLPLFAEGDQEDMAGKVTLTLGNWDQNSLEYYTEVDPIVEAYKAYNPNVTIEIETFANSEEYENMMKVRQAGGKLPDVFPLKPYMLVNFKDSVIDLTPLDACKNNKFAGDLAIDGKVLGIPLTSFYELVYYRKSAFENLGIKVPQTWSEFLAAAQKIKDNTDLIPIAIGLKDAWPNYPYNEFMPYLESGDGNYNNLMASDPAPFSPGKPYYESYKKIDAMYRAGLLGDSPLGIGFDQTRQLFATGKAAIKAAGQWYLPTYETDGGDMDDLGVFFLPVRDDVSEDLVITTMADMFFSVSKDSKNLAEAKDFMNWFFTDYYKDFIVWLRQGPTMKGIEAAEPFLKVAFDNIEGNSAMTVIPPDGEAFTELKNATQFDVKRIGQEMYSKAIAGEDYFDAMMADLNKKWANAMK